MTTTTTPKPTKETGPVGFFFAAIFNFLMLLLANAHAWWRPLLGGVVTEAFADMLWAVRLGCIVQIVGNVVLIASHPWWLRRFADLVFATVGMIGAIVGYRVFPLDLSRFGDWATTLVRVLMIIGIVGSAIAIVVAFVRLIGGEGKRTPAHP